VCPACPASAALTRRVGGAGRVRWARAALATRDEIDSGLIRPIVQAREGEDAAVVTVVPADLHSPRAHELGRLGLERFGGAGCRPRVEPLLPPAPAPRARAVEAQLLHAEAGRGPVGPLQREAYFPVELDGNGRFGFGDVHGHALSVPGGGRSG